LKYVIALKSVFQLGVNELEFSVQVTHIINRQLCSLGKLFFLLFSALRIETVVLCEIC
jgi:hypothetical protein